jgi:chemotaxis protein methyltransferase CheR
LIDYIIVPTTELFRDPEVWTKLKNKYFNKINSENKYKIWIPDATSDDELFTLLIVINELSISNIEIIVTSAFEQNFDIIHSYNIPAKKFESSKQNYAVYNPEKKLEDFFNISPTNIFLKKELQHNITFKKFDFFIDNIFEMEFDIVLFRNRLLYYNLTSVNIIFDKIFNSLKNRGLFCIGIKESIKDWQQKSKFSFGEKDCNILIKKK